MNFQNWLDRLRDELKKRKLPSRYSARLIEELTEHFVDLQMENQSMEALPSIEQALGMPKTVAETAENELRRRTFAGRHPLPVFALLPIPVAILTWVTFLIPCVLLKLWITPLEPFNPNSPSMLEWGFAFGSVCTLRSVPFVLAAWLFMSLGQRVDRLAWGLTGCGIVAVVAAVIQINVLLPDNKHNLMVCFSPGFDLWHLDSRMIQAAIPLTVGLWKWQQTARSRNVATIFNPDQLSPSLRRN